MNESPPVTISVAFLHPVFDALLRRGFSKGEMASLLSLPEEGLYDPVRMLPANSVYTFLGWSAATVGDPLFNARVGQKMAAGGWAPLVPLMTSARTIGDFLQKFGQLSSEQSRSATYRLIVEGPVALWQIIRPPGANRDAAFADAVAVGFFVQILKSGTQEDWDPVQVIAVLSDTSLVPQDLLPRTSVMSGQAGLSLRFPSGYLGLDMPPVTPPDDLPEIGLPGQQELSLVERVSQIVEHRISEPGLGVSEIAKAIGLSNWKLQSSLSAEGSSISEIRQGIRRRLAIERVVGSSDLVGSIATKLGYTNSANFTRAFRVWTGKSPREFRRNL